MLLISYLYFISIFILGCYGLHRFWLVTEIVRTKRCFRRSGPPKTWSDQEWPKVCVQIPLYNEPQVAERIIRAVADFDYPREKFEIQVVDDSSDETVQIVDDVVAELQSQGLNVQAVRREQRQHYKAGALQNAMGYTDADFFAIFDADFIPPKDFLLRTMPSFQNEEIAFVQTRWGHLNRKQNILTRAQAVLLDAHFCIEHLSRYLSGACFNFNGTAGIWRRAALDDVGGWEGDTLTEDLDLTYRSYLKGWRGEFLVDVVCPAELPDTFDAYKSQQYRWSKGTAQVLKKLFVPVMTAPIPLRAKVEAFFHLSAHICYLLLVFVTFATIPISIWRSVTGFSVNLWLEMSLFLLTLATLFIFFGFSQYQERRGGLLDIFAAFLVGIGISAHCSLAALQGLSSRVGAFVRTPKSGVVNVRRGHSLGSYLRESYLKLAAHPKEFFVFAYLFIGIGALGIFSSLLAVPFAVLLLLGYCSVLLGGAINE